MTTLFRAPRITSPRSTGIKNGGVTSYDTRIVKPVSRIVGDAVTPGQQVEFRWRSSSSAFHNPRETKLAVKYKVKLGPLTNQADFEGLDAPTAGATNNALKGKYLPSNVRFTACPNTALFGDGCQYQVNSTMVENQPNYYDACKVKLYTKYDDNADTSGSCGLITRRKDLHAPTKNDGNYPFPKPADTDPSDPMRQDVAELAELYNPKQELLRQSFGLEKQESGEIEIFDNIWLSSFEHGYFVAGADHTLSLTVSQHFADMFHSQKTSFEYTDEDGAIASHYNQPYTKVVMGELPANSATEAGTIYVEVLDISLHVAMAGTVPSIPPSVALKYSELMISNRELTQEQNEISLVVPPSTRALYCFSRQQIHDVRADAEEMGLAGAGIDEVGLVAGTAGNTATMPSTISSLIFELGGQVQPSSGGYTNMDVTQFRAGRAFTDALSVVGKPSAMRGTTWDFIDWCGKKSANGRSFPGTADGVRGAQKVAVASEVFGDQGPGYFVRMILPPNSLSNVLTVRCNLAQAPGALARQQLTIVAVHDSLWTMQYAPPAELPIETKVSPIT
jgi:hypothetical protein